MSFEFVCCCGESEGDVVVVAVALCSGVMEGWVFVELLERTISIAVSTFFSNQVG